LVAEPGNDFEEIRLYVEKKELRELEECRIKAVNRRVLLDEFQKYVPAQLVYKNKEYDVRLKLKGTLPSHWADRVKWSFRVVLNGDNETVEGMRFFSVQLGRQRGYYVDQYYHTVLDYFGVLNLKYFNIELYFNDMYFENYALEEFFDSPIPERHDRPDGPIIKFIYDEYWEQADWVDIDYEQNFILSEQTYLTAPLKSFKYKSGTYPNWKKDSNDAMHLLQLFRDKELRTRDVFDIPILAKYFAVNTLFGCQHSAYLANLRFYYNPNTKLLEPIGYDMERTYRLSDRVGGDGYWIHDQNESKVPKFTQQLFNDTLLVKSYYEQLRVVADSTLIASIFQPLDTKFTTISKRNPKVVDRRDHFWDNIRLINNRLLSSNQKLKR